MDRGCLYGVMEVLMTGILRIIIYKGWGFIHGPMGEDIKVNGRIIKWMAKEYLNGQMVDNIRDNMKMIIKMVKVHLYGQMVDVMKGIG